jgi:anti-anti-sigma regulatory factor
VVETLSGNLVTNSGLIAELKVIPELGAFLETCRTFRDGHTIILQPIFGLFDQEIASQLIQKIKLYLAADQLFAQGQKFDFLIDMQAVDDLQGDGLRLLSESCQFLSNSSQCTIAFCGLNDSLSLIFEISRMDQKFQVLSKHKGLGVSDLGFPDLAIATS